MSVEPQNQPQRVQLEDVEWVVHCAIPDPNDVFVEAGRSLKAATRVICRGCPVRLECVSTSYKWRHTAENGYWGALSPGDRKRMTAEEALAYVEADTKEFNLLTNLLNKGT